MTWSPPWEQRNNIWLFKILSWKNYFNILKTDWDTNKDWESIFRGYLKKKPGRQKTVFVRIVAVKGLNRLLSANC